MKSITIFNSRLTGIALFMLLLSQVVWGQTATAPAMGNGDIATPYQIATIANLYWISQNSAWWDKHFLQTADIDASPTSGWSGGGWGPIGNGTIAFTGVYDGGGLAITNLHINRAANIQGLFGRVAGASAEIVNTHIRGGNVSAAQDVALLVGDLRDGAKVFYCSAEGTVSASSTRSGGLVGYNASGIIENSYANATVTGTDRSGVLTGQMWTGAITKASKAIGNVSGTSGELANGVAGFVGFSNSASTIIENNYNLASATNLVGSPSTVRRIAAFLGYTNLSSVTVRNNYSAGNVINYSVGTDRGFYFRNNSTELANFDNNFWLSQQSNQTSAWGATALTDAQAAVRSNFTNWDFVGESTNGTEDIWVIHADVNDGFPYLFWENLDMSHCRVSIAGECYSTLRDAFASINAGNFDGQDVFVRINESTTETSGQIVLTAAGGYTSVTVSPAKNGIAVSGSYDGHLIDVSQATMPVIIDGRVMGEGLAPILQIMNDDGCAVYSGLSTSPHEVKYLIFGSEESTLNSLRISNDPTEASGWCMENGRLYSRRSIPTNVHIDIVEDAITHIGDLLVDAGEDILFDASVSSASNASRILTLRAKQDIILEANSNLTTTNQPLHIVLWADADATDGGFVWIRQNSTINTHGGHLWMGGGSGTATWNGLTVGDGFAQAKTVVVSGDILQLSSQNDNHQDGVILEKSSISTESGDIIIKGKVSGLSAAESTGYGQIGVYILRGSSLYTTSGNISISGITASTKSTQSWFWGVLLGSDRSAEPNRIETLSGSIYIEGNASQTASQNHSGGIGIFEWEASGRGLNEIKTTSGDISLIGHNKNTTTNSYGGIAGLQGATNSKRFVSQSGNILINGKSDDASKNGINLTTGFTVGYDGTNPFTGDITIQADKISALHSGTSLASSGNLIIKGEEHSTTIGMGGATGALQLPASYFSTNFKPGFSEIIIGSDDQTGNISINELTLNDDLILLTKGILTLGGNVSMGDNNVTLGEEIDVVNLGSPANYFKTNGSGKLRMFAELGGGIKSGGDVLFPIGNSAYNPVIINNRSTADWFEARVIDVVKSEGLFGYSLVDPNIVNRTWVISKGNGTSDSGDGVDFEFQWNAEAISESMETPALFHFDGTRWEKFLDLNVMGNIATFNGYKGSFSPFAIGDANSTLPVELISFTAQCRENTMDIRWVTATEINSDIFILERSKDGKHWEALSTLSAAGNSKTRQEYVYNDANPGYEHNYYRLKQSDFDGTTEIFSAITARCEAGMIGMEARPNPNNGRFDLILHTDMNQQYQIMVQTAGGVVLRSYSLELQRGFNQVNIDLSDLSKGLYIIKVQSGSVFQTGRVMLQ
ncbi:MAG: T9SS type A sorting domain-containing protein [Cyclobacteriaceae bacterium]|nr:T9SS type A sorting domain-containing protein [Cyclobacteriaceae bacterium]